MESSEMIPDRDVPSKRMLFCPDCGYESRSSGDWQVAERDWTARYRCPECEFVFVH